MTETIRIGVLTSGGDAQGMNAAVRAVARAGVGLGAEVYAVLGGYQGLIEGGDQIRLLGWDDVAGIQHRGGTVIGTARSPRFRERDGLKDAVRNCVATGIDRLVAIGGDGTLAGADELAQLWPELLGELVESGELTAAQAKAHPTLRVTGIVGSIDNDMVGTDMTVGADSALHRILEAIDAISSTAASHHRAFVIEVMGRRCGYLAMTAAIAGGCDYAFVPESPPEPGWEDALAEALRDGRRRGRRESIVIVAEGARDRAGQRITAEQVRAVIEERLGIEARVSIPGHVQRGGTPSAFDRSMATQMGYAAARDAVLGHRGEGTGGSTLVGLHRNRVRVVPLMEHVARNRAIAGMLDEGRYDKAMSERGESFGELLRIARALAAPERQPASAQRRRVALVHAGGLAPGMNAAARAVVRLGVDRGHTVLGVEHGFLGFARGQVRELTLADVDAWTGLGGAELGTRRFVVGPHELYAIARTVEEQGIEAIVVVGGFDAYASAAHIARERGGYPALNVPIVCVPATIDNNLPGSELAIGTDTALGAIVEAMDRIKQSASAARRCFVIETMGKRCGYLALQAAMSAGAEQVYLPEEGITLDQLALDTRRMRERFEAGRRLYVVVRSEEAHPDYTTDTVARIYEAEGGSDYDVRTAVLGHIQQGGDPSPFDRVLASRLAAYAVDVVTAQLDSGGTHIGMVGLQEGRLTTTPIALLDELVDAENRRPLSQWWFDLLPVVRELASDPVPGG